MPAHGARARKSRRRALTASVAASRRAAGVTLALLVGACATYWPTLSASSAAPVADAFQCAMTQTTALGFKPTVWNKESARLDARRPDASVPTNLPAEERVIDVLEVAVSPAKGGEGSGAPASVLSVRAKTVIARFTRAGWREDGAPASAGVQEAARALLGRCSAAN